MAAEAEDSAEAGAPDVPDDVARKLAEIIQEAISNSGEFAAPAIWPKQFDASESTLIDGNVDLLRAARLILGRLRSLGFRFVQGEGGLGGGLESSENSVSDGNEAV